MSKKKISIKSASEIRNIEKELDNWIKKDTSATQIKEDTNLDKEVEMYRLSLDIPKYLHRRIKKTCAVEDISIKDRITEILIETFPET